MIVCGFGRIRFRRSIMAVSGVSSAASIPTSSQTDPRLLFMQLSKAISSGDVNGAQQAYAQLTQALGNNGSAGSTNNSNDPFSQALAAIGQSLQNGDIGGAQQALANLQQQMQGARGHHHHGGHHGGGQANAGSSNSASNANTLLTAANSTSGNAVDVTA
jgi:hypothetical protein